MTHPFVKMNGLGNDFVVVDVRRHPLPLTADRVRALSDRQAGIGFDQMLLIAPPTAGGTATMLVRNADGSEVGACGNGARCVAALLLEETGAPEVILESTGGTMRARRAGTGIAVDMGEPRFAADAIPLAPGLDPLHLTFPEPELAAWGPAACVSVGNPHAVFVVPDTAAVPLADIGPRLEAHPAFPEKANISFITVEAPSRVRARVWERGAGATLACGTAACAIAAVAHRLGHTGEVVEVHLPGGPLQIDLRGGRILMTGPASLDWTGTLDPAGTFSRPAA